MTIETMTPVATLVPESDRLSFLPRHFGAKALMAESMLYAHMRNLCADYKGGYWDFHEVSNGAFFMAPASDPTIRLELACSGNYSNEKVSPMAAGVTATLFMLNNLAARDPAFVDPYYALRDYAGTLPERKAIWALID